MSPNNSNRPMTLSIKLESNPVLKAQVTAFKVREYLRKNRPVR